MTINVTWNDKNPTIIHLSYSEHWTWEDWQLADIRTSVLLQQIDHPVNLIFDFTHASIPRDTLTRLPDLVQSSPTAHHPNVDQVIIAHNSPRLQVIIDVSKRVYPEVRHQIRTAGSVADAHSFLNERRREQVV